MTLAATLTPDVWESAFRLGLAALLAGLVGAEREKDAQIAGIRTHAVLAIGAALTMLVSMHVASAHVDAGGAASVSDPGRVAAQVVSGIGFLGAGAIIRLGTNVRGLTTAASLWTVAGIGLAVGSGYLAGAVIATLLLIVVLNLVDRVADSLRFGLAVRTLRCEAHGDPNLQTAVTSALASRGIHTKVTSVREERETRRVTYEFRLRVPDGVGPEQIIDALRTVDAIDSTRVE